MSERTQTIVAIDHGLWPSLPMAASINQEIWTEDSKSIGGRHMNQMSSQQGKTFLACTEEERKGCPPIAPTAHVSPAGLFSPQRSTVMQPSSHIIASNLGIYQIIAFDSVAGFLAYSLNHNPQSSIAGPCHAHLQCPRDPVPHGKEPFSTNKYRNLLFKAPTSMDERPVLLLQH